MTCSLGARGGRSKGRTAAAWMMGAIATWGACAAPAGAQEAAPLAPPAPADSAGLEGDAVVPATGTSVRAAPDSFSINAFDVKGVTQLDQATVEDTVYAFLGPGRTTADVENARKALQSAYAARGLESVQVDILPQPEEQFAAGLIEITVTEAPVGKIIVAGAKHHSADRVRQQIPSLVEGKPLNVRDLQTDLAAANRFPDRQISPTFNPGTTPGTIDVELNVEDEWPIHGSIELNNDHGPSTEPLRLTASLRHTNVWGLGHTLTGTYIVAPQDRRQSEVFSGSYLAPLIGTPWTLLLYGYTSNSNVASLGGVNVLGDGYQIGARAIYRLPGERVAQNVTFGLDYKDFNQNITLGDAAVASQPIHYLPLYAAYGLSFGTDKSVFDMTLSTTAGFRAFKKIGCFNVDPGDPCTPADLADQFQNKAFDSKENFVHANLELDYRRTLPADFVAAVKLFGQLSDSPLPTNEQFGIGGLSSVRGYLQSESVGDLGYALSFELNTPSIAARLPDFVDELRAFGFIENGQTRVLQTLPEQSRHEALLSVGGGFRIRLFDAFSGELSVGLPLWNGPTTRKNDVLTQFSAKGEF